jgi:hypothetical protein
LKVQNFPTLKIYKNSDEIATFDSEKFDVDVENLVKFAKSYANAEIKDELSVNKKKAFGKCLGRK